MKKDSLKSVVVLSSICLIVAILLSGINAITAPIIEKQASAAANAAYLEVLPEATDFEAVEGEFPATVLEMRKDVGGSGFAFKIQATSSYSQSPMSIILGIDNAGKITKMKIVNYAETKGSAADFEPLFAGKDATMADVVAGVTYTTNAIKAAVKDAYDVFFEYADIEKSDEQKLQELFAVVLPEAKDKTGVVTLDALAIDGAPENITGVYAPAIGIGYVITGTVEETTVVMGVNAYGKVTAIYDLDGNDLADNAAYDQIKLAAETLLPSIYNANHNDVVAKMVSTGVIASAAQATQVDFSAVNNRVVAVYKLAEGYAYVAKAEGFGGVLEVCYVINENGDIVKYATLKQNEEDLAEYGLYYGTVIKDAEYAERFNGKTVEGFTDDTLIIAGSTFTTNATKECWNSIKAAHEIMTGGAK